MAEEGFFQAHVLASLGGREDIRLWRQLNGQYFARDSKGGFRPVRVGPPPGAADLSGIVLATGQRIEIEIKASDGRVREEQKTWAENMRRWHAVYLLLRFDPSVSMAENVRRANDALTEAIRTAAPT